MFIIFLERGKGKGNKQQIIILDLNRSKREPNTQTRHLHPDLMKGKENPASRFLTFHLLTLKQRCLWTFVMCVCVCEGEVVMDHYFEVENWPNVV